MKFINLLITTWALITMGLFTNLKNNQASPDDPITLSKELIANQTERWSADALESLKANVRSKGKANPAYLLLEAPEFALDLGPKGFNNDEATISRNDLLQIISQMIEKPSQAGKQLALASINQGLEEFSHAYAIAQLYKETGELDYTGAYAFLDNRLGFEKIQHGLTLLEKSEGAGEIASTRAGAKILKKAQGRIAAYPTTIPRQEAQKEVSNIFAQLQAEKTGLAGFSPYQDHAKAITELHGKRLSQRRHWRSSLTVNYPNARTIWQAPDTVSVKWESTNIPEDKNIKFYLTLDDMVIQELGTFANINEAGGIVLRRGLRPGTTYQVVAMELFPLNPNYTAKFATPYFAIEKRPKPEPKPEPQPEPELEITEEAIVTATEPNVTPEPSVVKEAPKPKDKLQGRSVSFVKELAVVQKNITITLWDHGEIDGDVVSIYLNGEQVVNMHTLTGNKISFNLVLDPDILNELMVYAHNLGALAPNTVAVEVSDGLGANSMVLNSDLQSSEAVKIRVK